MRSKFAQWLDEMQRVADANNVTVQARHIDVLTYYFESEMSPSFAFRQYTKFLDRWNAITDNGRLTEPTS